MRYHCRFKWDDNTRYGIVNLANLLASSPNSKGQTLVDCAVGPNHYAVPNSHVTDLNDRGFGKLHEASGLFWGGNEYDDFVSLCQLVAMIREERLSNGKLQVGHQFGIGVGDGSANYVVTKVMKVNCNIEWRAWCPDRYYDHHFGCGGRFKVSDVERYVDTEKAGRKLFPGNQKRRDKAEDHFKEFKDDWERRYGPLPKSEFLTLKK